MCDTLQNVTVDDFRKSVSENQIPKALASHATDFEPPLYNIWKQEEIAEACGCSVGTVNEVVERFFKSVSENQTEKAAASRVIDDFKHLVSENQMFKAAASHATDFEPPRPHRADPCRICSEMASSPNPTFFCAFWRGRHFAQLQDDGDFFLSPAEPIHVGFYRNWRSHHFA